jgi:D-cysteine desulfhydrase
LPTPVLECLTLERGSARLWLKHDGLTHSVYGGNKARKILPLLADAERRGARRILTLGAAGSHHVLTTALFARARGLGVAAVLTAQPATEHALDTLRAIVAGGVELHAAPHPLDVPLALVNAYQPGDYWVPPGGSNRLGALGAVATVSELVAQVRAGELPEPDLLVVPLGSGGTAAGLLAGVLHHGLKSRVLGVLALRHPLVRARVVRLARRVLAGLGTPKPAEEVSRALELDISEVGAGYGHATPAALAALTVAREALRLELDLTYTGKAFAAVLARVNAAADALVPTNLLYVHTLSAAPLAPLLAGAPSRADVAERFAGLLLEADGEVRLDG